MIINRGRTAIAAATVSLTVTTTWAQQAGQMARTAPGVGGGAAICAQSSEGVTRTIDVINARIEDARQTNDASKLRASIGDLQSVFAQIKRQLADCVALGSAGGAMGNMPGMDHSKMPEDQAASTAADSGAKAAAIPAVVFTVRTDPAPPRSGKNGFEVTLKNATGKPITDAVVSLAFSMPAMPSMKTDGAPLTSAGNGVYKGSGTIGMSGDWDVTITVVRRGQSVATKKVRLTAK